MPTLEERLSNIFSTKLPDGIADLETLDNGHVVGHVVSSDFRDRDYVDRRKRIREILDRSVQDHSITREELLAVSTLLTYTPEEWEVISTDTNR